ncbi:MAG: hypothetical protein U0176_23595 [Bacteroidia bacterium]
MEVRLRKPFVLLSTMDRREIKEFRQHLRHPRGETGPDEKLYDFFERCHKVEVWNSTMDKEAFQRAVRMTWKDSEFDRRVSELHKELENFLVYQELEKDKALWNLIVMRGYVTRPLGSDPIERRFNQAYGIIESLPKDDRYHKYLLDATLLKALSIASRSNTSEENGFADLHLRLDQFYFIQKLRFMCATATEEGIRKNVEPTIIPEPLAMWLQDSYDHMPIVAKGYFHAYHLIIESDEIDHGVALLELLNEWSQDPGNSSTAVPAIVADLYSYLQNHYVRRLNLGILEVLPQIRFLYEERIRLGLLFINGKLSPENFKNIISTYCKLGEVQNARDFFNKYLPLLTDDLDGAAEAYNKAIIRLHERKYAMALNRLEELGEAPGPIRDDPHYGLDIRCNLAKGYFEYMLVSDAHIRKELELKLEKILHAFPDFIRRRDVTVLRQRRFENFREAMRDLSAIEAKLEGKERTQKLKELLNEFRSSSNLPDKGWFIQMAEALMSHA